MVITLGKRITPSTRAAWRRRLPAIALGWVAAYGALRVYWESGHMPARSRLSPIETDLVAFTGWASVALCGAAALVLAAFLAPGAARLPRVPRRVLLVAASAIAAALVASGALLLLDVIGGVLPGLGVRFYPLGALSRAACVGGGLLVGAVARSHARRTRSGCASCGRADTAPGPLARTPAWAFWAAYLSVAGCMVRIAAQAAVGFGDSPMSSGPSAVLFEIGFVLGGTLLPAALVHRFGRVWPRWVPRLAGRGVPRRLVLWPGTAISGAISVYFGLMLAQMVWERLHGRNPFPPQDGMALPETFFWVAVPAYAVWGAGMAVAALAYARRTRAACRSCGR
ncbi:hypothetical protein [Actinomadura sp. NEAU-AAG7]|uniref:hypothetical protein n=1 Tax=Actinomadura sp. NEAU-AAG7 TaxID=2839640 RepID=UPI001BE4C046|nr:hypothetical protein [Actinomadura sp. NEAU-AAG7]MBT2211989.1 hypothetical protein [Actinomadura sp. NEAU-AAG7]